METDISKLHEGTDGFYYDDFLAPDKAENIRRATREYPMVAERWTLRPNMQLSGRGRAENRLVRLPEIHRLYGPGDGAVNFKHAEMNTFWECEVRENRKGRCTWASAPAPWRAEKQRDMIETDKIYNMDCLEGMSRMPEGSVDAIIADLPYGVLNRGNRSSMLGQADTPRSAVGAVP